jgi:hypothetical protein
MPGEATVNLNQTTSFTIHFSTTSAFSTSQLGQVLTFVVYAFRDGAVMLAQFVLNIMSMILFKKYLNKKNKILSTVVHKSNEHRTTHIHDIVALEPPVRTNVMSIAAVCLSDQRVSTQTLKKPSLSKSDTNVTSMVIVMCLMSFLVHIILLVSTIYPVFYFNIINFILYFIIDFSLPLKALIDFFLFYFFNKNFKKCTLKLFNL